MAGGKSLLTDSLLSALSYYKNTWALDNASDGGFKTYYSGSAQFSQYDRS